jgi:nicotinamide mononucleotide transporter
VNSTGRALRFQLLLGGVVTVALPLLSLLPTLPFELSLLEAVGVVAYAWSVWLLARNRPLGWWIGLIGVSLYAVIFFQVQLYAEVGIQAFYFVTSLQAIWLWLRGGNDRRERPVGRVPWRWLLITGLLGVAALIGLRELLIALRGAAPFWDALTTVLSLIAHLYLMGRFVESWYLWIAVDIVYVPLYASRGLYVTSALYLVFLAMAVAGLITFLKIHRDQRAAPAIEPA